VSCLLFLFSFVLVFVLLLLFFFYCCCDLLYLHSFPTRRSSDLLICTCFLVLFSTKNSSHFGQFLPTGLSQETNSQSGYLSHPKKTRFFFDFLSTISPCLHVGHVTPIFFKIGFVLRQFGKLEQAINLP